MNGVGEMCGSSIYPDETGTDMTPSFLRVHYTLFAFFERSIFFIILMSALLRVQSGSRKDIRTSLGKILRNDRLTEIATDGMDLQWLEKKLFMKSFVTWPVISGGAG
ncbi:MAG: hypothetical protein ABIK07_05140, partial [Planctomycetota bacterium]